MDSIKKGKKNKKRERNEGEKWRKTVYYTEFKLSLMNNIINALQLR